ncbi:CCAAT/enhancer-binding protein gamma-like [Ylistrum balloti]|uniref:CCAAT/enhancer-binding protein gamma-like n=1 Tax=Ylistrum balloti TaxID=509963 RepID=UPI002905A54B|nr:CCAAT/enhancer-binding protein gamma-like [Ylistrum balloti]XP_060080644.1 CCAAT/enhancer-binding protein gamma-like [Ylistrum balloti]
MPPKRSMGYDSMSDSEDEINDCEVNSSKKSRYQKGSDEYTKRRERNNIAVRKSREKSRAKAKETSEQVNRLRNENEMLEQKVQILSKELSVLKDLFLAHAGTVTQNCTVPVNGDVKGEVSTDHEYSKINSQ